MSDLISREALLDDFRKTITEKSDTMDWLNMISRQPIAYDVDKVIEALHRRYYTTQRERVHTHGLCKAMDNMLKAEADAYENAIGIVKAGGADE